jgi:hypothetical protein
MENYYANEAEPVAESGPAQPPASAAERDCWSDS